MLVNTNKFKTVIISETNSDNVSTYLAFSLIIDFNVMVERWIEFSGM